MQDVTTHPNLIFLSWSAAEPVSLSQYVEWLHTVWDSKYKLHIMTDLMDNCKVVATGEISLCNNECANCIAADDEYENICHSFKILDWLNYTHS